MDFTGIWHIYEMGLWDEDYFNMEVQAYIEIKQNNLGNFQFGLVSGQMDGKVVDYGVKKRFEFTWEGDDEGEPVCGSGWLEVTEKDKLKGEFRIHLGDDSGFLAKKVN